MSDTPSDPAPRRVGGIGRLAYFLTLLGTWCLSYLMFYVLSLAHNYLAVAIVLLLANTGIFIAASISRARDMGTSPWLVLVLFVPVIGLLYLSAFLFVPRGGGSGESPSASNASLREASSSPASLDTLRAIEPIERETIRRVTWRLMPLLMAGYFCAYLDRSNVGMAATTMVQYLGFTNAVFGFGAGLFFLGYYLGEMPSNLILNRVGARRWIARILFTWGIVAALTGFVWNEGSFYGIRFLLGLAEAGFYPGVLLYMTWWFPSYYRTRMMGVFQSASVISLFLGPPIGGLLLHMQGVLGLQGWQWLYIIEGLPPIIMCFVTWKLLTDRPHDAVWLAGTADLAAGPAGLRAGAARGGPQILARPGARQPEDLAADARLCRSERVVLRAGVLPAADRHGPRGIYGLDRAGERAALFVRLRGDDLLGLPFRRSRRADLARRRRRPGRRRRAGGLRPDRRRPSGRHDDRAVCRDDGSAIPGADVLVAA